MALRNVVMDGDPILKKVCRPVEKFDKKLATLLDDMGETMLAEDGMGLAGPQVGIMRRVFVAVEEENLPPRRPKAAEGEDAVEEETPYDPVVLEFINPEIVEEEGEQNGYEGCLSFPGQYGAIRRPAKVKVKALDRDGKPFEYEAEGMTARCLCHEINHLDGITIDDLAEYFYDPEVPHELDTSLHGGDDDGEAQEAAEDTPETPEAEQ